MIKYAIVGGGIIGLAVAYGLAAAGETGIVVFESEEILGTQATAKCAGGVRAQFATPVNIELSKYSIDFFVNFEKRFGIPVDFKQQGYLFLLDNAQDLEIFRKNGELQREHGVDVQEWSPEKIKSQQPHLKVDDLLAGAYCPTDGYGDPHGYLNGYATLCRQHGVDIVLNCSVEKIEHEDKELKHLKTSQGLFEAEKVLIATGACSAILCRSFGVDLPLDPIKRQIHVTRPIEKIGDPFPLTIDFGCGLYFHRESGGLLLGAANPEAQVGFDQSLDENFMETIIMNAINRVPLLETAQLLRGWAGLYAITPDHNALLGNFSSCHEVYYATGFSGHGFMHAPAVGDCMAATLIGKKPPVDISSLSLGRFDGQDLSKEFNVF